MKQSNWLIFLINGIIGLIIGILLLFVPEDTILSLTRYFAILLIISGIVLLVVAIKNLRADQPYAVLLIEALAAILIGLLVLIYTKQSLEFFVILIGIWALIIGIVQMIISTRLRDKIRNHSLLMINGFLTAALGVLLFFNPFSSLIVLGYIVGILALLVGSLLIYFSIKIKGVA
jgi:uncharacterized membrane protein HdeD (DUF308 family)